MPSSHLILCHPPLLLAPIPPSIRVFSNESTLRMRWPKYWSFSFSISPSKEHPGLIFRMDWLDLFAVQRTLKSLLQHHSSKVLLDRFKKYWGYHQKYKQKIIPSNLNTLRNRYFKLPYEYLFSCSTAVPPSFSIIWFTLNWGFNRYINYLLKFTHSLPQQI